MKQLTVDVFWNGEYIGSVLDPRGDNFDFYGTWKPVATGIYTKFLQTLGEYGEVWVAFGAEPLKPVGTVEFVPGDEIEIKLRPIV